VHPALIAADVGSVAYQTDNRSFWILQNHSPITWLQLAAGGSLNFVAGEALSLGHILTFDAAGDVVKASAVYASSIWEVTSVATAAALATASVNVATAGMLVPILFGAAPAAGDNGKPCFLSTTAGQATLTPPGGSGNVVFSIGVIQGADGITSTPAVLFQPQYISRIP
jgi:hypothetical protein